MTISSGMAMEIHFCMGERTGVDFSTGSGDICGRCGMKAKKGGCCSEEQKFIKLSDDHKTSSFYQVPSGEVLSHVSKHMYVVRMAPSSEALKGFQNFPDNGPPLYAANCVFRI